MKCTKLVKISSLLIMILINIVFGAIRSERGVDGNQTQCEDSCQVCQRVVYQMKFQGFADCDINNGACRGTCYKIKEMWGNGFSQFDQFINDIFGKCEICFRTGFCSISQCKEQEQNELEVINQVLNASKLNARLKPDNKLVQFPEHEGENVGPNVTKINNKIEKVMKKDLKSAMHLGTTENVIPKFQNVVSNYIDQANVPKKSANAILNGEDAPVSSASVSFYNDQVSQGSKQLNNAKKTIEKLDNHIKELKILKEETSKPSKKKVIEKVIKKEEKVIQKLVAKVDKVSKKLNKDEKDIKNLVNNPKVNEEVKVALNKSLLQIRQYTSALDSVKGGLNQDRNILKNF